MNHFKAQAKFLITSEYLVLHGARGLALPLNKCFQELEVNALNSDFHHWTAYDEKNVVWFEAKFSRENFQIIDCSDQLKAEKISGMLNYLKNLTPHHFRTSLDFKTHLNFSRFWGLGTSSTLISLLAQWSGTDGFILGKKFFGGSGYDVACATAATPIIYELKNNLPQITPVKWAPAFKHQLYFLYLGTKQDSKAALESFQKHNPHPSAEDLQTANRLTQNFLMATNLKDFKSYMKQHETLISKVTGLETVKEKLFPDFQDEIKSLGAWGGDFVLVASAENPKEYFAKKGYSELKSWNDLIK